MTNGASDAIPVAIETIEEEQDRAFKNSMTSNANSTFNEKSCNPTAPTIDMSKPPVAEVINF